MKKLITILMMLIPALLLSQKLPVESSSKVFQKDENTNQQSISRNIPPGYMIWSQLPCYGDQIYASQLSTSTPINAKVADDFRFTTDIGYISAVRWWISWWNPGEYVQPTAFNIHIYEDDESAPGTLLAEWSIPFADVHEDYGCLMNYPTRDYWAMLDPVFFPEVNKYYWISFQPVLEFPPQTGIVIAPGNRLNNQMQIFPELGITEWTATPEHDMAFELYSAEIHAIPLENWALYIAVILMLVFLVIRF